MNILISYLLDTSSSLDRFRWYQISVKPLQTFTIKPTDREKSASTRTRTFALFPVEELGCLESLRSLEMCIRWVGVLVLVREVNSLSVVSNSGLYRLRSGVECFQAIGARSHCVSDIPPTGYLCSF